MNRNELSNLTNSAFTKQETAGNPNVQSPYDDEMRQRFQLSTNEIDELKNSLFYVESRLQKELDTNNGLVDKHEQDVKRMVDLERILQEQIDINKFQTAKIESLTEKILKLEEENKVPVVEEVKETDDRDYKLSQIRIMLMQTRDQLEEVTRERDRYLKDLEVEEESIKEKNAQIKRLKTELSISENTIDEFVN